MNSSSTRSLINFKNILILVKITNKNFEISDIFKRDENNPVVAAVPGNLSCTKVAYGTTAKIESPGTSLPNTTVNIQHKVLTK